MAGIQAGEGGDTAHTTPLQGIFWLGRPGAELHDSVALFGVYIILSAGSALLLSPLGGLRGGDRRCPKNAVLQSGILLSMVLILQMTGNDCAFVR